MHILCIRTFLDTDMQCSSQDHALTFCIYWGRLVSSDSDSEAGGDLTVPLNASCQRSSIFIGRVALLGKHHLHNCTDKQENENMKLAHVL